MIGRYLARLNEAQRERVLTMAMRPGAYSKLETIGPCLVGTAQRHSDDIVLWLSCGDTAAEADVEGTYDGACERMGTSWVNDQIRLKLLFGRGPALSYRVKESVQVVNGPPPTWAR